MDWHLNLSLKVPNSNDNKVCEPDCKVGRYLVWQIVFKSVFHLSSSNFSHGHVNVEENQCVPYKQASDIVHYRAKYIDIARTLYVLAHFYMFEN